MQRFLYVYFCFHGMPFQLLGYLVAGPGILKNLEEVVN